MPLPRTRARRARKVPLELLALLLWVGCSPRAATPLPSTAPADPPQRPSAPPKLALTPPMGFNNWNAFGCDVNEALIKETADVLVASGLKDAGYVYVNIDDCWSLRERGPDGKLAPDPKKFPSGIRGVADYVHGLGLKLGIYGDAGTKTCAGYPGSLGKEALDAQTWADWGVDYLKYDNCYNQSDGSRADFVRRYTAMREAIDQTGRPMVYSICEWGQSKPWEWAAGVGHLWRTTGDISDSWSSVRSIIAANASLAEYAGPGHWNDPDMLEIGNGGMTRTEYRTHMSLWSMMAAPLIIGTDLRSASEEALAILRNERLIGIDQDPLGKQASVVVDTDGRMVFAKPLESGELAVALYNSTDAVQVMGVNAVDAGLPEAPAYRLSDVWTGTTLHAGAEIAAGVPAHGAVVYRVSARQNAADLPPSVSVGARLPTLTPSQPGGAALTTEVKNQGVVDAAPIGVGVELPEGWTAEAGDPKQAARLSPGQTLTTRWNVTAPRDTPQGSYPMRISANYRSSSNSETTTLDTELLAAVVVPPPDGVSRLSQLAWVSAESALGPVERDMENGDRSEADGNLISLGGKVYTRGLGTRAPSKIVYYLGGRCSKLAATVGVDDGLATSAPASFTVLADDKPVAESGLLRAGTPPKTLTAKLDGANWLELVTKLGDISYGAVSAADWANPLLFCGSKTTPNSPERLIFSFESGSEGFSLRDAEAGGSFRPSAKFHTDGKSGLEVTSPADGNWFGRKLEAPLDLGTMSRLAFDVQTGEQGTVGEFAVQVAPGDAWCQGGHWAWVNPNSKKTIKTSFEDLSCPKGVELDKARVLGVWVFLKGGTFVIDRVRAE